MKVMTTPCLYSFDVYLFIYLTRYSPYSLLCIIFLHSNSDYGGWPDAETGELPIEYLSEENRRIIAEKCSGKENPRMPNVPTALGGSLLATAGPDNASSAITPPHSHNAAVVENQSNIVVGAATKGGGKGGGDKKKKAPKGGVTPSPMPPKGGASKQAAATTAADKKPAALSSAAVKTHQKWQVEADKAGGGKIVVGKPAAKKLVFDALHDGFKPMNINGLHATLKAVVPSVVLRSCLDDMADAATGNPFADDSDDEEDGGKKKKKGGKKSSSGGDEHTGSLRIKEGRNVNTTLYYTDHTKLANNGNGLLPEDRSEYIETLSLPLRCSAIPSSLCYFSFPQTSYSLTWLVPKPRKKRRIFSSSKLLPRLLAWRRNQRTRSSSISSRILRRGMQR